MFKKFRLNFIIIFVFTITMMKINCRADVSQSSNRVVNMDDRGLVTENTWQPLIQTHNWLSTPTVLTPATSRNPVQSIENFQSQMPTNSLQINTARHKYLSNNQQAQQTHEIVQPALIQMPIEIIQEYQMPSSFKTHAKNKTYSLAAKLSYSNLAHTGLKNSSFSTTSAKGMATDQNNERNISNTMNSKVKANILNKEDNILPTILNCSINNENLIDNEINNQQNLNPLYPILPPNNVGSNSDVKMGTNYKENINDEILLGNGVKVIWNKNDKTGSYADTDKADDDYKDPANDDNDLRVLDSTSRQVLSDTSMKVAAAIANAVEKLGSLNMENLLFSLASTGNVKGRKRQIYKGHRRKYTSQAAAATATTTLSPSPQDTNRTEIEAVKATLHKNTQTKAQLRNFSASSTRTPTATLLDEPPTSKGLKVFSSGRKIKKLKKKFQKFLLPLVLAYKLKFLALIPLLIGGLILLVGSTGLAGFFFALFTAVMSLKTDPVNASIIKSI